MQKIETPPPLQNYEYHICRAWYKRLICHEIKAIVTNENS